MTRTVSGTRYASPRQIVFLRSLARERVMPEDARKRLNATLDAHDNGVDTAEFRWADKSIKWCLAQERIAVAARVNDEDFVRKARQDRPLAEIGVYRKDGYIYVVKPNKEGTRRYAVKLVVSPPRLTENGEEVDFSYERALGMAYLLTPEDRMSVNDMKDFMIKYRKCIKCGHTLKQPKTLLRAEELGVMVGKTCARKLGLI